MELIHTCHYQILLIPRIEVAVEWLLNASRPVYLSVYRVHCVVLKSNLFVSAGNPNFHVNLPRSHNGVLTLEDSETNNETDNYTGEGYNGCEQLYSFRWKIGSVPIIHLFRCHPIAIHCTDISVDTGTRVGLSLGLCQCKHSITV